MLRSALAFFLVALIAGAFGFSGYIDGLTEIAEIIFWVAIALVLVALVLYVIRDAER